MNDDTWKLDLGAMPGPSGVRFRVWAPHAKTVAIRLTKPKADTVKMESAESGYFESIVPGIGAGARYVYVLDGGKERPDPASRFQPDGVHAPSAVVDPNAFRWTDQNWRGLPLKDLIIYELHTGTFTKEGTCRSAIAMLDYLKQEVGVTAIELMPVAQCPGARNWGYDGVYLFAPQASYGGPDGLKAFVDACHAKGLAVIMDVVYNHLGPEGNYLGDFGPYFTDRYRTPWGSAVNFDGRDSDEVRHYIVSNACYWVNEYHVDALRLDAIHGIFDFSARHILRELGEAVHGLAARLGRTVLVIAESDLNDVRVIAPTTAGGHNLDAQWSDDFHHALRVVLTNQRVGYYRDFGRLDQLATALREGFVYEGQRSDFRGRRHGSSSRGRPLSQFVIYAQNHDQIGNRALGDRLSTQVPFEAQKVALAAVLLSPSIPLLFMGEEYGETAPFQYFIDHGDPALIEAVRNGRRDEFASFGWQETIPDPQAVSTFKQSRIQPDRRKEGSHAAMLQWTHALIDARKTEPSLGAGEAADAQPAAWVHEKERVLILHRRSGQGREALLVLGFNREPRSLALREPVGTWTLRLNSTERRFGGDGQAALPDSLAIAPAGLSLDLPPFTVAVYLRRS
ncbi:MAG TPA: malto-oligosyltrehalose trehalohydrolase [Nitrospiraceae bacterium]